MIHRTITWGYVFRYYLACGYFILLYVTNENRRFNLKFVFVRHFENPGETEEIDWNILE